MLYCLKGSDIMKIERISENQIRCTLTRADLASRELRLSELAYGSEKAKSLFHDMMQQAAHECGFEADDLPLMIEAIPASSDSIVLIITKVDDPEELDSRFSKFGAFNQNDTDVKRDFSPLKLDGADELLNLIGKVKESLAALPAEAPAKDAAAAKEAEIPKTAYPRLFSFGTMDGVILASKLLENLYNGANTLYKDIEENVYLLVLAKSDHTDNEFNRICNMLSEYGSQETVSGAILAYLEEHCETILAADAVQTLSKL